MSEKSDSKKQYIIEKATAVFSAKGFKSVTMKDIVEACEISRGGLYLYYSSTEEIFKDVCEKADNSEESEKELSQMVESAKASDLLLWFIKEQKKAILSKTDPLIAARYEYAFYKKQGGDSSAAKSGFDTAVKVLKSIIIRGCESGEFECEDPSHAAASMMYAIEGMKVCSATFGMTEKKVDSELLFMVQRFMEVE